MAYKLLKSFADGLEGHPAFAIHGPVSPLLTALPWSHEPPLPLCMVHRGRLTSVFYDEAHYYQLSEDMFGAYLAGRVTLGELEQQFAAYAEESRRVYEACARLDLPQLTEAEVLAWLKKDTAAFEMVERTLYIETLDYDVAARVLGPEKRPLLDAVWEEATRPTFPSFEARRLAYLLSLERAHANLADAVPYARYVYTDYFWSKPDEEIRTELEHLRAGRPEKEAELARLTAETDARKAAYDAWAGALSEEEREVAEFIQLVMRFRDVRKDPIAQNQAALIRLSSELLRRAGIDPTYGRVTTMYELAEGVEHLRGMREELMKREEGSILIAYPDRSLAVEFCDFDAAVEEFYTLARTSGDQTGGELKGQVARKGKVRGTARIVLDPHEDQGFQDGDILVTSMTRPEFVPLMKRASAVVTNEGGITCHAAIVSRELGIPCIIGTKTATRFLKTGDLVEVDAEQGIVRRVP